MTPVESLIAAVQEYNPNTNHARLRAAYDYGEAAHDGQFRHSGEPYFTHPVAVARILAEQRLDDDSIITALLHDVVEDTRASYKDIESKFGGEVARLVDGVTKLTNLQLSSRETKQAENFRKLFMAMSQDLRVILVKLADRLHNMRTIKAMRPDKQQRKAEETMDIYAPLAGRMGMQWMREELEDLSFKVINPEGRASILRRFVKLQQETGDVIQRITNDMRHEMDKAGIEARVFGRAKKPYSIWRKMQLKEQGFSRLSDIYGFRVLVDDERDCYAALGAIHQRWRAVPGRFKDYISQPKSNGYRSIQTTVSGRDGKRVEVQVRTYQMHDVAESGVAAHWAYRDGVRANNPFAVDPAKWIASLNEQFGTEDDHEDFLEAVKLEMYTDQVFCFTPKGDVIKLPRGATPLDFAYAIHTRIGNGCVGAKVDGMRAPLWTRLRNGQSVQVITAAGQTPQSTWLDIAVTGKARSAIRRALRNIDRERYIKLGRELARVAFQHVGKRASDKVLSVAAKHFALDRDELLFRLGSAEMSGRDIVAKVYPELEKRSEIDLSETGAVVGLPAGHSFNRATCCQPLPGERIVGVPVRGQGIVVHTIDCDRLADHDSEASEWLDLRWAEGNHPAVHSATVELTLANSAGTLGRVCSLIGDAKANISDLKMTDRKPDYFRIYVTLELSDAEHLHMIMTMLEAEDQIATVSRYRDPESAAPMRVSA